MPPDVVKELGFLTLGTRFRRIGDALQAQAQVMLASAGMDMPAAHFPMLAALDRLGPLNVSELAQAVGVSQPVVSRSLLGLQAAGLVDSTPMAGDRRVRSVRLSRKGLALVRRAKKTTWPAIEAAVSQACRPLSGSLLVQLAALEAALAQAPLQDRAATAAIAPGATARKRHSP
jgi:DNA-binding MarR family transcriptional regulator